MNRSASREAPEIQLRTHGEVPPDAPAYARDKVEALARRSPKPIRYARIKLTKRSNPAVAQQALAQATLDVSGRPTRAHVAASTFGEAIDLLHKRLAARLARLAEHWEARRGGTPLALPGEWRHGSEPTHRPDHFPRPPQERQIVRHKSYSLARESPDEAAFDLEMMDYHFHLFTEIGTGEDSVVYRTGPTGYRLAQVSPHAHPVAEAAVPLTVSNQPAPRLALADAKQRLDITGLPFVFFADDDTGRGQVLYHRYDGHYGLITPAE